MLYENRERLQETDNYCVFMLDVDNFKYINDTYGHDVGDRVLEAIGRMLTEYRFALKKFLPLRWGGEEFVVVYCDSSLSREDMIRQMESIRQQISELRVAVPDDEIQFTVTVGAAAAGEDETIDGLIAVADSRMYYGKKHGKDCLVFTHDEWRNI